MILVPNEVAWLAERVAGFRRDVIIDTPFGAYSELVVATALPLKESSRFGADTDAVGVAPADGTGANRDLGIWQISNRWHAAKLTQFRWRDPFDNARMMRLVHDETLRAFPGRLGAASGFTAWTVFNAADNADADVDPEWGAGVWHLMIAPALLGVRDPWEPTNPHTTGWRRT